MHQLLSFVGWGETLFGFLTRMVDETQTFVDICKAELQKSGQDMERSELFIVTHTRKDGIPVNSECAVAIVYLSGASI
ncbi:hypothetical protein Taro_054063 [Colocasia esculenta]|uniref:Uncharacterized protein n=1 Tax=Colocasia esculenta TaxID=4460 RepID=A0A843XPD7_COLES|nr:hypothetical protein [Colocasia esculenta]